MSTAVWAPGTLVLVLALAGGGCAQRERAIAVAEATGVAAERAASSARALAEAAAAAHAAHLQVRDRARALQTDLAEAQVDRARTAMRGALLAALRRVDEAGARAADEAAQARRRCLREASAAVDAVVQPYRAQERSLAEQAHRAEAALKAAPADKDLRLAWLTAKQHYLAVAAVCRDLQLEAGRRAAEAIELAADQAAKDLALALADHRQRLTAVHDAAAGALEVRHPEPDLGPDPVLPLETYEALAAFADGVAGSQQQIRAYLTATGLGRDSLVADGLRSFGAGLFGTLLPPKGPPRPPGDPSRPQGGATTPPAGFTTDLDGATTTAVDALRDVGRGLLDRLGERATAAATDTLRLWQDRLRASGAQPN